MIRAATQNDVEQLVPLVMASDLYQKKELEGERLNETEIVRGARSKVVDFMSKDDWRYFIAEENGKIVGYVLVAVDKIYLQSGSLTDLYVRPENRKQGLARLLIDAGLTWLQEQRVETVNLAVHQHNQAALNLYRSCGFEPEPDPYVYLKKEI